MAISVSPLTREEHLSFVDKRSMVSYLQCPSWGEVRAKWENVSMGWRDEDGVVVGAGLVLLRRLPGLRRSLAYLPEGPILDWGKRPARDWLDPMVDYLREQGAFAVKMSPQVVNRTWHASTVKAAIASPAACRLRDVSPDSCAETAANLQEQLYSLGWRPTPPDSAFPGESRYAFHLPLDGRSEVALLEGCNQQWRRNVRKGSRAGVIVGHGTYEDLSRFHALYQETARRDGFVGWPLDYFQRMYLALSAERDDRFRLYLAEHEGETLAATTVVNVAGHAGYAYGGSSARKREVQASTSIHWHAICEQLSAGAEMYDMRGISDELDPGAPKFGVLRFKLGTGGQAVEYLPEWNLPLVVPHLHKVFTWSTKHRGLFAAARSIKRLAVRV